MHVPTVLILQPDRFSAEAIRGHVCNVRPDARCLLARSIEGAELAFSSGQIDLFVAAADIGDWDILDLLLWCRQRGNAARRTFVTTHRHASRMLVSLRTLSVDGVFDVANEPAEQLENALKMIDAGRVYWSPRLLEHLVHEHSRIVRYQLTPPQQLGLAIMGDGCGDDVAACRLNMTQSSMRALRRDLYRRFGGHDRQDMICWAARLGYTRVTSEGIVAFGLALLVLEYLTQSKRPVRLPSELLARCRLGGRSVAVV